MLHNSVVPVGVNTNIGGFRETVVHDAPKYTVSIRITTDPMDYMIWLFIIKPPTFIDLGISWFRGRKESKIANNLGSPVNLCVYP